MSSPDAPPDLDALSDKTSAGWVSVAVLGRPRGNRGELTAESLSSRPERFSRLHDVRLAGDDAAAGNYQVEEVWDHRGALIFKFRGIDSISDAEKLRGAEVQVPLSERVELDPDEYFHSDLIGCEVRERVSGRTVGRVTDFAEYGGPPLLEIDGGRVLIPFVKAICVDIRPGEKRIFADLPEGLEGLEVPEARPEDAQSRGGGGRAVRPARS